MTAKHSKPTVRSAPPAKAETRLLLLWKWIRVPLLACCVIYVAVLAMFFNVASEGREFVGDDTVPGYSLYKFAVEQADSGTYPYWCPYIFGGFPSFAAGSHSAYEHMGLPYSLASRWLSPRHWADVITVDFLLLGGFRDEWQNPRIYVALMLYAGLLAYLLMRQLGFQSLISVLSGILMAWNPYLISLATATHGGKLMTFMYMPLILLLAYNVMQKRRLIDLALLAVAWGWQIAVGGHTQVLFYSLLSVGLLYLTWLVMEYRETKSAHAFKPAPMLLTAVILGFAVGAVWYIPLLKYTPFSIRGMGPALAAGAAAAGYSITDATQWSFPPKEILTFIVPSWFGLKSPYYWGGMPFTSSSFYFGVVPLLFAVLAFFGKKDKFFWGLVVISAFSLLLSFGQYFQSFYAIFFNYLPFFNKFRTPSLIVLLIALSGIIWAGYGLKFVTDLREDERWRKFFLYAAIVCGALLVLFLMTGNSLQGMFGSFSKAGEEARYNAQQVQQLTGMRFDMLRTDLLLALLWLGLALGACYLLISGKVKPAAFLAIVIAITVVDLWRFDHKFFDPQPAGSNEALIGKNRVVQALEADHSIYRVLPIGRIIQDNRWAAWEIASLGGYHGAKLRSYQDLLDNVFYNGADRQMPLNLPFYSAMNCKYLVAEGMLPPETGLEMVAQDPTEKIVLFRNPKALDRVYFVEQSETVKDRAETVRRLMQPSYAWDSQAIVDQALPGSVKKDSTQKAEITEYLPHRVKISASTPVPTLMVLSDTYYAPGWTALDNGKETPIYQVNGYVRGVYLTAGPHEIEYRYTGKYEKEGVTVATTSYFLVWGLAIGTLVYELKRRRRRAA